MEAKKAAKAAKKATKKARRRKSNPDAAQNYIGLAEINKDCLVSRRGLVWKVSFGFWTALALITYLVYPQLGGSCWREWTAAVFVFVTTGFFCWLVVALAVSNHKDVRIIEYFRDEALVKMGEPPVNKRPASEEEEEPIDALQKVLLQSRWSLTWGKDKMPFGRWIPQVIPTVLLLLASLYMLFWVPQADTRSLQQLKKQNARLRRSEGDYRVCLDVLKVRIEFLQKELTEERNKAPEEDKVNRSP